jgi:NhaC family Na+:H+ antiporter
MIVALVIYTVAGFSHHTASPDGITGFSDTLTQVFRISPWLLFVPAVMVLLIVIKAPSIVTLFVSFFLAGIFALIFQPHLLSEIAGTGQPPGIQTQLKGLMMTVYGNTQVETGHAALNDLVSTRGMAGMMNTIWLIICAMCFGGAMKASGMLNSLITVFLRFMKNTLGVVSSTVFSALFLNIIKGDQYLSIILTGDIYRDIYRQNGYESRLLSRTAEDGATVTSPLIPWNTCGMTQATVLGIPTLTYLPYCFFNIISPLMSVFVAAVGYKIKKNLKN